MSSRIETKEGTACEEGKEENSPPSLLSLWENYIEENKAGYTVTPVGCGWAGAVLEKVSRAFGQEQ